MDILEFYTDDWLGVLDSGIKSYALVNPTSLVELSGEPRGFYSSFSFISSTTGILDGKDISVFLPKKDLERRFSPCSSAKANLLYRLPGKEVVSVERFATDLERDASMSRLADSDREPRNSCARSLYRPNVSTISSKVPHRFYNPRFILQLRSLSSICIQWERLA